MSVQARSNAIQNEIVRLYCRFINDGVLNNPAGQPMVEILDCDGVTVLDIVAAQIESTGVYFVDWYVPANLPLGEYYDKWTFQWNGNSSVQELTNIFSVFALDSYINSLTNGKSLQISNRASQLMTDLANNFIYEAQHKPVYWEQGRRIRQEDQQKRRKNFYYFELDSKHYNAEEGAVYFHNGQKFTVRVDLQNESSSSSTSSSSSSVDSSSSGGTTSSSSSESSESTSSSSSTSMDISSSSTSQGLEYDSEINYEPKFILTTIGTGDPLDSGTLTLVSGVGSSNINFNEVTKKTSKFSTIFDFAFHNWNKDPRPIVRLNNTRIIDDGWHADYQGKIYLDRLMAPEDYINVSYNFAYFSDEELLSFLKFGLQMMNGIPPASQQYSSLETAPREWDPGILLWAAITALKRIVFGLNCQEVQLIFGGPDNINSEDAARHAQEIFKTLYAEYTELWKEFAENVKSKRLPGMALSIQPEYTLPGGRCMSADTYIKSRVNGNEVELKIKDLFGLYERGEKIEVLSYFDDELNYFPINKIWYSGKKKTYSLIHGSGSIRLSEEHLVYDPVNKLYFPVKEYNNQSVLILQDNEMKISDLIEPPREYKLEDVYDIEVPISENFIGNNIVTHNSRWFRYMFKSG
jgi:hypothetical protein